MSCRGSTERWKRFLICPRPWRDSVSPRIVAKTNVGKIYQGFDYDMPLDRIAALVCAYQGRPLASTSFTTRMFVEGCTNSGVCADCYYSPGNFGVHAYYNDGKLFLMADEQIYSAVFMMF